MPWKQLLRMGKIKPSQEAIDLYMSGGEQTLERVRLKIRDIGMEDIYWAIQTPSQAAIMLYGLPPPTPKETPDVLREIFVKKEGLLKEEDVAVMKRVIDTRKKLEHGQLKNLTGKELDELLDQSEEYLKRLKKLFGQIEELKEKESVQHIYETTVTMARDAIIQEGSEGVPEEKLVKEFDKRLIESGKLPAFTKRTLQDVFEAKKKLDSGKISKDEIFKVRKEAGNFSKTLLEHIQRSRGKELEKSRIRIKTGNAFGEVYLLESRAFIVPNIDAEQKEVQKAPLNADGSLGMVEKSSVEEFEQALAKEHFPKKAFIKGTLFKDLEKIFGPEMEVLLTT